MARNKKRKRKLWKILLTLGVVVAIVWSLLPRPQPLAVTVAPVIRVDELKAVVNASGEIQTKDSVDIQAEIAGVIIELPVREGDRVEKGQVLLRIDPFQTESDMMAARASVNALEAEAKGQEFQVATAEANAARDQFLLKSAEVELLQAETNLARSRLVHKRDRQLLDENIISADQFELTETDLKLDEARVEAAGARVEQQKAALKATRAAVDFAKASTEALEKRIEGAKSTLRRAEDLFSKTTIRSPLSGVVVKLNVEEGERAVPGIQSSPIATLMTIADLRIIEAELEVDETDIVNVKLKDVGKVLVDALPDAKLVGEVIEIGNSPIASTTGGQEGKDFKVVLRIADPPDVLRPGMSCEADITTDVRHDVLVVPIQALTEREVQVDSEGRYVPPKTPDKPSVAGSVAAAEEATQEEDRREELQGVFLVAPDGRALFRPIETGILGDMDVEVLTGLELGDEVVVGPLQALRTLEESTPVTVDRTKPFRRFQRRSAVNESEE